MNIVLISQCSKQALPATRRILDQFAERKGVRTWLTPITEAGLATLHELLRRGARKNTAVACHLVRSGEMELLWIVGNRRKFDRRGNVPTDRTSRSVLDHYRETGWQQTRSIALLAGIAGLFHDFGKANALFIGKLDGSRKSNHEPWRHEWISVRLFEAFVGDLDDRGWLRRLCSLSETDGAAILEHLHADRTDSSHKNPLKRLTDRPVARAIAWLICTHHRLPVPRADVSERHHDVRGDQADRWIEKLSAGWITPLRKDETVSSSEWDRLWSFPKGLPVSSRTWRTAAKGMGRRAVEHAQLLELDWMSRPLVMHTARCALMLSDHLYSSGPAKGEYQDPDYPVYANTAWSDAEGRPTRELKQKLDEHCIGVSRDAYLIVKRLPTLRASLPSIGDVRALRQRSKGRFAWQNRAFALSTQAAEASRKQGGFFVNMASTGTGKTLANARMAFGLAASDEGCRFTILLGLRTLTLQTAEALQSRIGLSSSDLAVLIGSSAVKELHEHRRDEREATDRQHGTGDVGSESAGRLFAEHEYVRYDGEIDSTHVGRWMGREGQGSKLHRLISAPVVVGTIDHLMPATESARGGRQIGQMLRLLTSDLVLDEPDDFDLADQPALCRLVHWSGLLGSRVIVSSATLPPALLETLFDAYQDGRRGFNDATHGRDQDLPIVCGWVDEHRVQQEPISSLDGFKVANGHFVQRRLTRLQKDHVARRWARLVTVNAGGGSVTEAVARTVLSETLALHEKHAETSPNGRHRVSVGLVRMANIDPLVQVARAIVEMGCDAADINLCIYHARHPLYRRARIERVLDELLDRNAPDTFWEQDCVRAACQREKRDQVFVVLATAVAEVGRDHCYSWAIVEPSSMRSIVQLVGRVLRHRVELTVEHPNVVLLARNVKALEGRPIAFEKPGFESKALQLVSHDLAEVLPPEHYVHPGAGSRLVEPDAPRPDRNLVDLEHVAMRRVLCGAAGPRLFPASLWWSSATWWCYALQARTRFRAGQPVEHYALVAEEVHGEPRFEHFTGEEWIVSDRFRSTTIEPTDGILPWPSQDDTGLLESLDEQHDRPLEQLCRRYLSVSLAETQEADMWSYHWWLGVHRAGRS